MPEPDAPPHPGRGQVSGGQPSATAQRSGLEASLPPRPHRVRTDAETGPGQAPHLPSRGHPSPGPHARGTSCPNRGTCSPGGRGGCLPPDRPAPRDGAEICGEEAAHNRVTGGAAIRQASGLG